MLQYRNGPCRAISGVSLAQLRRHMAAPERACLAADIIDGRVVLQGLTAKGIAALCGVNLAYVNAALNLTPEQRCEASRGARPLAKDSHVLDLEGRLQERLGTKVDLRYRQGKGALAVHFFNDEDLQRILDILGVKLD